MMFIDENTNLDELFLCRSAKTEPKIKFYFSVNTKLDSAAEFEKVNAAMDEKIKKVIEDMKL